MTQVDLKAPSCVGYIAQVRPSSVYQPMHELADRCGYVNLCHILQDQGRCQVEVSATLMHRQIMALHDLAAAIREACHMPDTRVIGGYDES